MASMQCSHRRGLGLIPGQGLDASRWRVAQASALSVLKLSLENGEG